MDQQVIYQQQPIQQVQQYIISDDDIIYDLLSRLDDEKLDNLIKEIADEKELRKLREKRMIKLKEEMKKEKNRMLKEVKELKVRMLKNLQEETANDEDDFEEEKNIKKKKSVKK